MLTSKRFRLINLQFEIHSCDGVQIIYCFVNISDSGISTHTVIADHSQANLNSIERVIIDDCDNAICDDVEALRIGNFVSARLLGKRCIMIRMPDRHFETIRNDIDRSYVVSPKIRMGFSMDDNMTSLGTITQQHTDRYGMFVHCVISKIQLPSGDFSRLIFQGEKFTQTYPKIPVVIEYDEDAHYSEAEALRMAYTISALLPSPRGMAVQLPSGQYEVTRHDGMDLLPYAYRLPEGLSREEVMNLIRLPTQRRV